MASAAPRLKRLDLSRKGGRGRENSLLPLSKLCLCKTALPFDYSFKSDIYFRGSKDVFPSLEGQKMSSLLTHGQGPQDVRAS